MSALLTDNGKVFFSWFNIDSVFDFIVSIGMRPYVELSFMPEYLANGSSTIMHYKGFTSPPKNWTLWENFITTFGTHIISRYGLAEVSQWTFEVWNEPNCGFFNGNQNQYFLFYQRTALALKAANSALRVGGPVTCRSEWLTDFIKFCTSNNVPYDFIATHEYPTDLTPSYRSLMRDITSKARAQVGPNTPLYYSEFNDGLYFDPAYHDAPFASSNIFHVVHDVQGIVDMLSWWTFTDIFEEAGQTSTSFFTNEGWGLLNIYKVPKPVYRTFQLLHTLGTEEVSVTTTTNSSAGCWAVLSPSGKALDIIVYNFDVVENKISQENVTINLINLGTIPTSATLTRIDDTNANAPAVWVAQGRPAYPTPAQIAQQIEASQLRPTTVPAVRTSSSSVQFGVLLPPYGSAVLHVESI